MMTLKLNLIESSAETEFAWSDQLQNVEVELLSARTGPNLGDLELDYTSEPYEFFKLYFPDNLIATIKEQTNLYAQQKISFLFYFFQHPMILQICCVIYHEKLHPFLYFLMFELCLYLFLFKSYVKF